MNFTLLLLFALFGQSQNTDTVDLEIIVTNINTLKGNIEIGLYNEPAAFPKENQQYQEYIKPVNNDTMVFLLQDLPKGNYAVALYHDVNSDEECNLNFLGIPTEAYGFSKNFRPRFSKPSFEDCVIEASQNLSAEIQLID